MPYFSRGCVSPAFPSLFFVDTVCLVVSKVEKGPEGQNESAPEIYLYEGQTRVMAL